MDKNIKNRVKKQENTFILILKCAVLSVLLFLIFILIYCYILSHTNISEETMFPVTIIITMISALIGSMICSTKIKKRGLSLDCIQRLFNGIGSNNSKKRGL